MMDGVARSDATIFALSSGQGRAGVAILRISGPKSRFVFETLSGQPAVPNQARPSMLRAADGSIIDRALTIFFAGPRSFTGEDTAEFHVHGGKAVIAAMLRALGSFSDCRLAEAGEFTRPSAPKRQDRSLGAEALADLIDAETDAQRRLAVAGQSGRLREEIAALRSSLSGAMGTIGGGYRFQR